MQLRYLTLCNEWGLWTVPRLEYNEDDESDPYEVGPNDGWKVVPLVEAKREHRKEEG